MTNKEKGMFEEIDFPKTEKGGNRRIFTGDGRKTLHVEDLW